MANTLRFKRGLASGIITAAAGEPLFTTDTFDLYIGNGTTNTRFQKYIASGTTSQLLRGDGSLLTMPIVLTSPSSGQVLKYNGTSWVNDSDSGITGSGTTNYLPKFTGASTLGNSLVQDNGSLVTIGGSLTVTGNVTIRPTSGYNAYFQTSGTALRINYLNDALSANVSATYRATDFGWQDGGGNGVLSLNSSGRLLLGNVASDNGLRFQVTGDGYFSGSVGIGVSPVAELQVGKASDVTFALSNSSSVTSGNRGGIAWYNSSVSTVANIRAVAVTDNVGTQLEFYTRPAAGSLTQAMTITSSGNLGLGVVPSAWASGYTALQVGNSLAFLGKQFAADIYANSYYDGTNFKYIGANFATLYALSSGQHRWFNAPGGSAGANITFTQAMTLTENGRLLLGTTSEGTQRLQVAGDVKFDADAATNGFYWDNTNKRLGIGENSPQSKLYVRDATSGYAAIISNTTAGGDYLQMLGDSGNRVFEFGSGGTGGDGFMNVYSDNVQKVLVNADGASYFNGGNVGIGTTSPNYSIDTQTTSTFITNNIKVNAAAAVGNYAEIAFQLWSGATGGQNVFGGSGTSRPSAVIRAIDESGTAAGHLVFATFNTGATNASLTEKMRLFPDGNFGIGTGNTNTGEKLQVNGTMKVTGASTFGNINAASIGLGASASYPLDIQINGSNTPLVQRIKNTGTNTNDDALLYFSTQGSRDFSIGLDRSSGLFNFTNGAASVSSGILLSIEALTGAATFSSSVTAGVGTFASTNYTNGFFNGTNTSDWGNNIAFQAQGTTFGFVGSLGSLVGSTTKDMTIWSTAGNGFQVYTNGFNKRLEITSTGAATFSSSVRAAGYNSSGGEGYAVINSASNTVTAIRPTGGGTSIMSTNSNGLHIAVGTEAAGDLILATNNTGRIRLSSDGYFSQGNGTNPSASITDSYIQYSADVTAGNAAPHFRTENGAIIKLYQETTAVGNSTISVGGGNAVLDDTEFGGYTLRQVVKALQNQGILA